MMYDILFALIIGLAFGTLQLFILRRVFSVKKPWLRVLLILLKLPLWALAFGGMALWWGLGPLLAFGLSSASLYVAIGVIFYCRGRKEG